ncbi:MAG TPA: lysophospholipid acyltransferase family protein [Candidatus Tumulicola sp.]
MWVNDAGSFPSDGFVAISNHSSWWDGLVPYALQRTAARDVPFFLMMDETQLRRYWFFRYAGAFSIDAGSPRDSARSVAYAADRAAGGGGVWIYPQGRLESSRPQRLHPGYVHVARRAQKPVVVVALRLAFLESQRPDAFVDIAPPLSARDAGLNARALATLRERLSHIDSQIAAGTIFDGRSSLFSPAQGPDGATAALGALAGGRFAR